MLKCIGNIFSKLMTSRVELHASETCPECGSQLAREAGDHALKTAWQCPNPDCPPQVLKRVSLWASPEAMDIKGCDTGIVSQLVSRGLVRDAAEFYRLRLAEIAMLDSMDKQRAGELFDAIRASKSQAAWRVLFGLGIPNVGATESQALCRNFPTLDGLFAAGRERIARNGGVSEVVARSLADWFADSVNRKLIKRLEKAGVNFRSELYQSQTVTSPVKN